jgi:hypothetical protein
MSRVERTEKKLNSEQHYELCSFQLLVPNRPNTEYPKIQNEVYCHSVLCVYIFAHSLTKIIRILESTGFIWQSVHQNLSACVRRDVSNDKYRF